jgi:ankyrin repeat protein
VRLLLAHGADPSLRNSRGRTPPEEAVRRGHQDIVELLTTAADGTAADSQSGQGEER